MKLYSRLRRDRHPAVPGVRGDQPPVRCRHRFRQVRPQGQRQPRPQHGAQGRRGARAPANRGKHARLRVGGDQSLQQLLTVIPSFAPSSTTRSARRASATARSATTVPSPSKSSLISTGSRRCSANKSRSKRQRFLKFSSKIFPFAFEMVKGALKMRLAAALSLADVLPMPKRRQAAALQSSSESLLMAERVDYDYKHEHDTSASAKMARTRASGEEASGFRNSRRS